MYKSKKKEWNRLDNAGKIFPCTSNKRDTKVLRFVCQLKEDIIPEVLQESTELSLLKFPMFKVIMRKGFFWFYFEETDFMPVVEQDNIPACSPLFDMDKKNLLFRISYYGKRINLEMHHSLTDGTGAVQFLTTIVSNYIKILHKEEFDDHCHAIDYDASKHQRQEDSFSKYYLPDKTKKSKKLKAYRIKGKSLPEGRIKITEGVCSVKDVLAIAKQNHTTMTVYLCAILLLSIKNQMTLQDQKKPVIISVPVNLRNFFKSKTARNFFGTIDISYNFNEQSSEIEDILSYIKDSFNNELTEENMLAKISNYAKLEKNIFARVIPLSLKNFILRIANGQVQKTTTASVSNVGKVKMPEGFEKYISHFSVFVSTKKVQFCVCSFGNNLAISFTSAFDDTDIQRRFFRTLTEQGVEVNILSNSIRGEVI